MLHRTWYAVALTLPCLLTLFPALPSSVAADANDQEVQFTSGSDTLYGSFLLPQTALGSKVPAVLIISGSGPTDRDGNNTIIPGAIDSNRNFARVLADQGIASLRYDKLGTGKTGLASYVTHPLDLGFDVYVQEAQAAYAYLQSRPEVNPQRTAILGHSEGGLIALVVANTLKGTPQALAALMLAAPLGTPYLETIRRQLTTQYQQAQVAGSIPQADADAALAELDKIIQGLKDTGHLPSPINTMALTQIFNPGTEKFLAQVASYDPMQLAASLPPMLPTLILRGTKDEQISSNDVANILRGFQMAGGTNATLVELTNVNHVFKEVTGTPNPLADYVNPALPFSHTATNYLKAFVTNSLA